MIYRGVEYSVTATSEPDIWQWRFQIGERTTIDAYEFLSDLKSRLRGLVQLTTDGHRPYLTVVEPLFGADGIDFAMLHKIYGNSGNDDPVCDARMKEFKATVRCIPLVDEYDGPGKCIVTGETVDRRVVIAKAY